MTFNDLDEGATLVLPAEPGDTEVRITTARGNHPNGVYAYRVDHGGHSVVYATDTEHYDNVDPALLALSQGADVLVNDAQYTPEEYAGTAGIGGPKTGWGHSTYVEAAKLAKQAGVKQLVLFHHDPLQNDAAVRDKQKRAQSHFANTIAAYEGLIIDL
jgi:ribonuclease BN (tRNA processing enzyme)